MEVQILLLPPLFFLKDLAEDYGLLKKLKKGKITQHQFNVATGMSSDEEEEAAVRHPTAAKGRGKVKGASIVRNNDEDDRSDDGEDHGQKQVGGAAASRKLPGVGTSSSRLQQYEDLKKRRQKRKGKAAFKGKGRSH